MDPKEYGPGTLAYVDSFAGLVPCKVLGVGGSGVMVRITATRGAYKRGEKSWHTPRSIVPRGHVYRKRGGALRIADTYRWVAPA